MDLNMDTVYHKISTLVRNLTREPLKCIKADTAVALMLIANTNKKRIILMLLSIFTLSLLFLPLVLFAIPVLFFSFCVYLIASVPTKPELLGGDEEFVNSFADACPSLRTIYKPPSLWGRHGLLQTVALGAVGRFSWQLPDWEKRSIVVSDGATVYFDVAEPTGMNPTGRDVTLLVVPGLTNFSNIHYVRYFCLKAQQNGYRCVVFNHVGMIPGSRITSSRIFTFGHTSDLSCIVDLAINEYPRSRMVLMGYSLGGTIVTKYAGEMGDNLHPSICGIISIGQAYRFEDFSSFRNPIQLGVMLVCAEVIKSYILHNRSVILTEDIKEKYNLDEREIKAAYRLQEVDEFYTRRRHGMNSTEELYEEFNSQKYLDKVRKPIILFNAADDPTLPYAIQTVKPIAENRSDTILIVTRHGGHLAYYSGGFIFPNQEPWIDGAVLESVNALVNKSYRTSSRKV